MVVAFILAGLGLLVAVPAVSVFLFLIGFGGVVRSFARNEYEEADDG